MPIPTPKPNEAEGSFMSRCIRFVIDEGTPQEQAIAICSSQYRKEKLKVMTWKTIDRKRASYIKYAKTEFSRALKAQANEYLDQVKDNGLSEEYTISAEPIEKAMRNVYQRVMTQFARDTYNDLIKDAQKTQTNWEEIVNRWFTSSVIDLSDLMTDTTAKSVRQIVKEAIVEGKSIREFQNDLMASYSVSERRAELIGRTEIIRASNAGSLLGAEETGIPMNKYWLATRDNRTRGLNPKDIFDHYSMDENMGISLDQAFNVSGEYLQHPVDFRGSPGNTINCRCTLTYEVIEEAEEEVTQEAPKFKPTNKDFNEFGGDLPDEAWRLLKNKTVLKRYRVRNKKGSSAFYDPNDNSVSIASNVDRYDTDKNKARILAHEYGHAMHFQNEVITYLKTDDKFDEFYKKSRNLFKENHDIDNFNRDWKSLRYSGEFDVKYGSKYTKSEIVEMYLAVADHIGGLTRGRQGYGHKKSYYNSKYNLAKMEVFAHASENYFVGNEIFKDYFPDLYEESIKYMKEVSRVYGR